MKCVCWDLDNTLWTGILVEDGPDKLAYSGRPSALNRVFANLIGNAVNYAGNARVATGPNKAASYTKGVILVSNEKCRTTRK